MVTINDQYKILYDCAEEYLHNMISTEFDDDIDLEAYFIPKTGMCNMNRVFERLCESLQNKNRWPNIIKFNANREVLGMILHDFDPYKVSQKYDQDSLYSQFLVYFKISNPDSPRNTWRQYANFIISGCRFLSMFKEIDDFKDFIISFNHNTLTKASLPMIIEKEVKGFGFSLACDFLKELGYVDYPKPDVHIKKILSALNLSIDDDYESYKVMIQLSESVGQTPYKVDKILWLISSGNFYLDNIQVQGQREDFIEFARRSLER